MSDTTRPTCKAVNDKDGKRCKREPLPGRRYCWQHETTFFRRSSIIGITTGLLAIIFTVIGVIADIQGVRDAVTDFYPSPQPTTHPTEFKNTGFENGDTIVPWQVQAGPCNYKIVNENNTAHGGNQYLAITSSQYCQSIYQDITFTPQTGETYRFGIWVRSPRQENLDVSISIWARGKENDPYQTELISIPNATWHCVDAALTIENANVSELRVQVNLESSEERIYHFDDAVFKAGGEAICANETPAHLKLASEFLNPDFEDGDNLSGWKPTVDCTYQVNLNKQDAKFGERYLAISREVPDCISFFQDVNFMPEKDATYTFRIWARSSDGKPKRGELVLRMGQRGLYTESQHESAKRRFIVDNQWKCIETSLTVKYAGHTLLRPEVYLESVSETAYYFDGASLTPGGSSQCPPQPITLFDSDFEVDDALVAWDWHDQPCDFKLNREAVAHHGEGLLAISKTDGTCKSIAQNLFIKPQRSDNYAASLWVRSSSVVPRQGTLALWTINEMDGNKSQSNQQKFVVGPEWKCVETALTITDDEGSYLRFEIYLESPIDGIETYFDNAVIQKGQGSLCPKQAVQLLNASFELGNVLLPWQWNEACEHQVYNDRQIAHDGNHYLTAARNQADCYSFYQDIFITPKVNETYHAGLWVRSSNDTPQEGTLILWANGVDGLSNRQKFIVGPQWKCVETSLTIAPAEYSNLRFEVYLDSQTTHLDYYFDNASISTGESNLCPEEEVSLANGGFENGDNLWPWQWNQTCEYQIINDDAAALAGSYYLAAKRNQPDCHSLYQDVLVEPKPGETYHMALWVRSSNDSVRKGTLALWALGGLEENSRYTFETSSSEWICIETNLAIQQAGHTKFRTEIYLDVADEIDYYFDNAQLQRGNEEICPNMD